MFVNPPTSAEGYQEASQAPFVPKSSDVFIALMGMTGAGKSTFISHCTDEEVYISEPGALESCTNTVIGTQEVRVHKCSHFSPFGTVYLVDTPGFDDTNRKDTDILKEIACWLIETYQQKIKLRGILYLHRISDNRMGGCAHKNLVMFKRLCGPDGIRNVVFVTTFWEKVDHAEGERRERTLQTTNDFWGFFMEKGAAFVPGWAEQPPEEVKLAIQTEMVDSGKDLDQTAAGQELQSEFNKEREKMQLEMREREKEMRDALATRDKEIFEFLRQEQEKQKMELKRRDREMKSLKVSMEKMHEEKIQRLEARIQQQQQEHMEYRQGWDRINKEYLEQMDRMRTEQATDRSRYENLMDNLHQQINDLKWRTPKHANVQSSAPASAPQPEKPCDACKNGYDPWLTCLTCGEAFVNRNLLFQHIEAFQHGRDLGTHEPESYTRPYRRKIDPYLTCLTCEKIFSCRDDLFNHIEKFQHARDLKTHKPESYRRPIFYSSGR
ncbi:P-loop containing nucleoside triphosphate hydrolase protein [Bisporella sp. PMI_857]|nr:P-loop containing nucleoside triphosphate hydrolase protein [Bisporella sp. PMI_857]